MSKSVTKSIQIRCTAARAFAVAADPANLPKWAVHNVLSARPAPGGAWELETPRGPARFVPYFREDFGILDHEFIDAQDGRWNVPARIVPAGPADSVYIITLLKPDAMPEEAFAVAMKLMDDELNALKDLVEQRAAQA